MPHGAQDDQLMQDIQLPELPDAAVLAILRCMPLQQRLRCALVCRSWAAAAAVIPAAIATSFYSDLYDMPRARRLQPEDESREAAKQRMQRLQSWLDSSSARVASLHLNLSWDDTDAFILFCQTVKLGSRAMQQLTSLRLQDVTLKLYPPAKKGRGLGTSFPALLELGLKSCSIPLSGFKLLQQATTLTHLSLQHNTLTTKKSWRAQQDIVKAAAAAIRDLVGRNPSLVQLSIGESDTEIQWCCVCDPSGGDSEGEEVYDTESEPVKDLHLASALSSMRQLQHLALPAAAFSCSNLAALPASLTALTVSGWDRNLFDQAAFDAAQHPNFSLQAVPHLTRLTALQDLQLRNCHLDPACLPQLPQLHSLTVSSPELLVPGPEGALQPAERPAGTVALLEAVRQLTQLRSLRLEMPLDDFGPGSSAQRAERLAAITASSQLTELVLQACEPSCLPDQALQHVLKGKLPHLQSLRLTSGPVPMSAAAVQPWVQQCPALEAISLYKVHDAAAVCGALLPLRASLTALEVTSAGDGDSSSGDAAAAAVAQLTALKALELSNSLTLAGVQQLTALRGLTRLTVSKVLSAAGGGAPARSMFNRRTLRDYEESDHPDVWQQLQRLCLNYDDLLRQQAA